MPLSRRPIWTRRSRTTKDSWGLIVAEREKERAFLATKIGQLVIALNKSDRAHCIKLSFEVAPQSDFGELAGELAKDGVRSELRNDFIPGVGQVLSFADDKGTTIELFKDWSYLGKHEQVARHRAAQARPCGLLHSRYPAHRRLLREGARFPRLGLDRRFLLLHALQSGPPHREFLYRSQRRSCITSHSSSRISSTCRIHAN